MGVQRFESASAFPLGTGLIRPASACLHLLRLSLRRQLLSRQSVVSLVATVIAGLIVGVWTLGREPSVKKFIEEFLVPVFVPVLLPIYAICFGAAAIGTEREDRTLIYLLITPLQRPLIYLTKFTSAVLLVLGWSLGSLAVLCALANPNVRAAAISLVPQHEDYGGTPPTVDQPEAVLAVHWGNAAFRLVWPAVLLGGLAYASLFVALGAIFRRGTIVSLAYAFFLEVLLGNMPGIVKRVSVFYYVACMIYDSGAEYGVRPLIAPQVFLPISGRTAVIVLCLMTVALLCLGSTVFTRREYRDLS